MTETSHPIPEDITVQRRTWVVQRIFWVLFVGLIALALAGLFGSGALSNSMAANDTLSVTYQRFQRITKETQYLFTIPAHAKPELRFNAAFQKSYTFTSILPPPLRSEATAGGFNLIFAKSADAPLLVAVAGRPVRAGSLDLAVATEGRPLFFDVLVYP